METARWEKYQLRRALNEWKAELRAKYRKAVVKAQHFDTRVEAINRTYDPTPELNKLRLGKRYYESLAAVKKKAPAPYGTVPVNPNFSWERKDGWRVNCMRCATASELQARGYDVMAGYGPYRKVAATAPGYSSEAAAAAYKLAHTAGVSDNTPHHMMIAGWRTKDGKIRTFYKAKEAASVTKAAGTNAQTLADMTDIMPDGARGYAWGAWKGRGGGSHIWNWEKKDGVIRWYESQSGTEFLDTDVRLYMLKKDTLEMVRIDDMVPTDELLGVIGDPTAGP